MEYSFEYSYHFNRYYTVQWLQPLRHDTNQSDLWSMFFAPKALK